MIQLKAEWVVWDDDGVGHSHEMASWWLKFLFDPENRDCRINESLVKWNGRYEHDAEDDTTVLVVFENDADAVVFLLRWA